MSGSVYLCLALLLAAPASFGAANDVVEQPTFYREVLPVLQENCQTCHRDGGQNLGGQVAPMAQLLAGGGQGSFPDDRAPSSK